ncbi:hypothetical protein DFH07DRAFT_776370 [Mycena maculata]|uniref:Uncharacterized protein n=1 Tax=Mycena maculata TaxID=230809 RepID=A0AAD7IMD8_9AGAR|nr:hypothetical protein DFH07DRAFT_776370 [Mycena maculata]
MERTVCATCLFNLSCTNLGTLGLSRIQSLAGAQRFPRRLRYGKEPTFGANFPLSAVLFERRSLRSRRSEVLGESLPALIEFVEEKAPFGPGTGRRGHLKWSETKKSRPRLVQAHLFLDKPAQPYGGARPSSVTIPRS